MSVGKVELDVLENKCEVRFAFSKLLLQMKLGVIINDLLRKRETCNSYLGGCTMSYSVNCVLTNAVCVLIIHKN